MTKDEKFNLLYSFVDNLMVEGNEYAEQLLKQGYNIPYDDLYSFVDDLMVEGNEEAEELLERVNA